jgi:cytochrome c peroxidase
MPSRACASARPREVMGRTAGCLFFACLLLAAGVLQAPLGLDSFIPAPPENQLTAERIRLGRKLFHDPLLSRDRSVSCASCHDPRRAFTDGRPVAQGVHGRTGNRRTPPILNRAYGKSFFWDGRSSTLEEQVLQPIQNPKEMDLTLEEAMRRLRASDDYLREFQVAFGRDAQAADLANALASYVRSILAGASPYDRFVNGDRQALSEQARAGLRLFRGKAGCVACHVGPNFTDERFHNTGVGCTEAGCADEGRAAVTGRPEDRGAFKTPTLRESARAAPYMHDGSLATLEDVIEHYDKGGRPNPWLDPEMHPLKLTEAEKRSLLAFLQALSGEVREGI